MRQYNHCQLNGSSTIIEFIPLKWLKLKINIDTLIVKVNIRWDSNFTEGQGLGFNGKGTSIFLIKSWQDSIECLEL